MNITHQNAQQKRVIQLLCFNFYIFIDYQLDLIRMRNKLLNPMPNIMHYPSLKQSLLIDLLTSSAVCINESNNCAQLAHRWEFKKFTLPNSHDTQ